MNIYSRKMKTACNKNLDVFDFKEETEVSDFAIRFKSKLENPSTAIDKYTFLSTGASGKSKSADEINYVPSLDIDTININHMATTLLEEPSAGIMADSNDAFTVAESDVNVAAMSASPCNKKLKSAILDLLPNLHELDEAVGMETDENRSLCDRSSSSSDVADDDGVTAGPSSDHCIDGWEMDSEDITTVAFCPDYLLYRGSYYTDSLISFTPNFIKMEGSEVDGDNKTFKCIWEIEDILHITSHWSELVEMANVKIHVLTKDIKHAEYVACSSGTELKFSVIDSNWYERLEAIASLNVTYRALWTSMLESKDTMVGYLPNFYRPFEEVVYPKGDADAVSISKRDFDLLQPDTFVNDTIIDFYIKYLKNKIKPDERNRLHFFNSFFFRKLADPDKDPLDASKGNVAYQRVKKWTRRVNLFEKDYVFIPVNYNYHWSLIVMCHLGEVATYADENVNESIKVPCVLHMDSIRGSHTGLQGLVQSYLKEEWKARQKVASEDISSRFDNLRFISLELPQQQNSFDCGLFLLHYVELFLEQAPLHFNPFKITKSFNFLNADWFPPAEASLKRVVIQKLICDLLENPYQEPSTTGGNEQPCDLSRPTTNAQKGTVVNLPLEDGNPSMHHHSSHGDQEIEISLISSSSLQYTDECKGSLAPIEEDAVGGGQFVYSQTKCGPHQDPDDSALQFSNKIANNNVESLLETSISGCHEIVNENSQLDSKRDQPRSPIPDSLPDYVDQMVDGNGADDPTFSGLESDVQHPTKKMRMTQL